MPKGDFLPTKQPVIDGETLTNQLTSLEFFRELPPVKKDDAAGCEARIKLFFDYCQEHNRIPTVELMTLAVGVSRQTLINWQNDDTCENGKIITRAKQLINALMTEWAMTGQCNTIYTIFSQKVNFGYIEPTKNEISLEVQQPKFVTPPLPYGAAAQKYMPKLPDCNDEDEI